MKRLKKLIRSMQIYVEFAETVTEKFSGRRGDLKQRPDSPRQDNKWTAYRTFRNETDSQPSFQKNTWPVVAARGLQIFTTSNLSIVFTATFYSATNQIILPIQSTSVRKFIPTSNLWLFLTRENQFEQQRLTCSSILSQQHIATLHSLNQVAFLPRHFTIAKSLFLPHV